MYLHSVQQQQSTTVLLAITNLCKITTDRLPSVCLAVQTEGSSAQDTLSHEREMSETEQETRKHSLMEPKVHQEGHATQKHH